MDENAGVWSGTEVALVPGSRKVALRIPDRTPDADRLHCRTAARVLRWEQYTARAGRFRPSCEQTVGTQRPQQRGPMCHRTPLRGYDTIDPRCFGLQNPSDQKSPADGLRRPPVKRGRVRSGT
jgi:hypothetical protein